MDDCCRGLFCRDSWEEPRRISDAKVARERLAANPNGYVQHIYGIEEVGGTSVLLLSDVPFHQLGYPGQLTKDPLPLLTWQVLQEIPSFVLAGSVFLSGIWWITARRSEVRQSEQHKDDAK